MLNTNNLNYLIKRRCNYYATCSLCPIDELLNSLGIENNYLLCPAKSTDQLIVVRNKIIEKIDKNLSEILEENYE